MSHLLITRFHSVIKIAVSLSLFTTLIACNASEQNLLSEEKAIQDILNPSLVKKIWHPNSCLTYHSRIGICLTGAQCSSRNGTIGGLCLAMFTFCCLVNNAKSNTQHQQTFNRTKTIVNLPLNSRCLTNSKKKGICIETENCVRRMGIPDGLCSDSFTCCQIESICGKTIRQNGTEIVNDLYPMTTSDSNVCQIMIERVADICQIRIGKNDINCFTQ